MFLFACLFWGEAYYSCSLSYLNQFIGCHIFLFGLILPMSTISVKKEKINNQVQSQNEIRFTFKKRNTSSKTWKGALQGSCNYEGVIKKLLLPHMSHLEGRCCIATGKCEVINGDMQMSQESTYIGVLLPHLLMENATPDSMPFMENDISRTLTGIYSQPSFCCLIGFYNSFQFPLIEKKSWSID